MSILEPVLSYSPTLKEVLLCIGICSVLSIAFGFIYYFLNKNKRLYQDMPISLILIPIIVCFLNLLLNIIFVKFNGTELDTFYGRFIVAIVSVFFILRFRSQQRTFEDLTCLLFAIVLGFVFGFGYIYAGLIFYGAIVLFYTVLKLVGFPFENKKTFSLKIMIPEDLNYEGVFDDILCEYCHKSKLFRIKSSDMGTMFVVEYNIVMKNQKLIKEMVDKIRTRNGNLNVIVTVGLFNQDTK